MNAILGKKIRSLREEKEFTQEYVANILGMSRQKYARIENGVNDITLEILTKLADLYGITVGDITKILDKKPVMAYRVGESAAASVEQVYEMLDLFYANKSVYDRMHYKDED